MRVIYLKICLKVKYLIHYISNYEHLNEPTINDIDKKMLNQCDIFMYQPLNKEYSHSEYDITNIKKHFRNNIIILKINYYRFKGFWYNSDYKPYNNYNNYSFSLNNDYGIHNSFIGYNTENKKDVIDKINNIKISDEFLLFFNNELEKFKKIDDNSDIDMFNYFIDNYKKKHLFHDQFHPTNLFFYEMFRQIIIKLENYSILFEDHDFIKLLDDIEMTHWASPILPIVKNTLGLTLSDYVYIFYPGICGDKKLFMNINDYYYIRLSPSNFKKYLEN